MDKIKELLAKAGVSTELINSICESLQKYKTTLKEQFKADHTAKLEEAKKVCIEETQAYERDLAHRLQIFCETKGAAIEAALVKQSAMSESKASTKLKNILSLLEGIEPNGKPNGSTAEVEKLTKQLRLANEERNQATAVANRQTALANKVLKNNRVLESRLKTIKTAPLAESVNRLRQPKQGSRRIDTERQAGKPTTTRPTIRESQDRRPVPNRQQPNTVSTGPTVTVDDIAQNMDEDLL